MTRNQLAAALIACGLLGVVLWRRPKKRRDLLWKVGDSLTEVLKGHSDFLLAKYPTHHQKFQRLRQADPEAAMGEAAVFSLLKTYFRANPEPLDEPGTGGVDFICHRGTDGAFVVEVTSLKPEAVVEQSGIPSTVTEGGGPFQMTTRQLFSTVRNKADQLADYPCPRVLAITSTHQASSFLLGSEGAECLLTSEPRITYALGAEPTITTNLRSSVFFAPGAGADIVPRRQSVSAILLIGLFEDQSHVVGLLHPVPARPLSIEPFRDVPFLRLANWPIVGGAIRTEWVVSLPEAKSFPHAAIRAQVPAGPND